MRRLLSWCGCLTLLVFCGCAMCANPYDCHFAAYGGRRERTDMVRGRVASVFDPAFEVSYAASNEQSPQPATPEPPADAGPRSEPLPPPGAELAPRVEPPADTGGQLPDGTLPELPEGTIELPEFGPGDFVPQELPTPGTLPPDLPGNGDRSAAWHPLRSPVVHASSLRLGPLAR